MQSCLNDERRYIAKKFVKYPIFCSIFTASIIGVACIFTSLGFLCNIKLSCTDPELVIFISIGINVCIIVTVFLVIPFIVSVILNTMFKTPKPIITRKRKPLTTLPIEDV
jgi:hypothetical protein